MRVTTINFYPTLTKDELITYKETKKVYENVVSIETSPNCDDYGYHVTLTFKDGKEDVLLSPSTMTVSEEVTDGTTKVE